MATLRTLRVQGAASGQAPTQPEDFVRKAELDQLSGTMAPRSHRHEAGDVDGLIPLMLVLMADELEDSQSVEWIVSGTELKSARVRLKPAGGLLVNSEGVSVDPDAVSLPGHEHQSADIEDLAVALYTAVKGMLRQSNTIEWWFNDSGSEISGTVRLKPSAGILESADGLSLDFGSGTNQAARGNHSHTQLHNPVTFESSSSMSITLNGQEISLEVQLAILSGLKIISGGLAADFGSGTNQVARGDHTHDQLHSPASAINDSSLLLAFDQESQVLSGTVRRDPQPGAGKGKIGVGDNGLYVELGTDVDQAAAGGHLHSSATEDSSGFMSAPDKVKLDSLWNVLQSGTLPSGTLPASGTLDILEARLIRLVNRNTGHVRILYLGDDDEIHGI